MSIQNQLRKLGYPTYSAYLRSNHWLSVRARFLAKRVRRCEACGEHKPPFHVHHMTYETLGTETESDLCLLCQDCHTEVHAYADSVSEILSLREATVRFIGEKKAKAVSEEYTEAERQRLILKSATDARNDLSFRLRMLRKQNQKKKKQNKKKQRHVGITVWRAWD